MIASTTLYPHPDTDGPREAGKTSTPARESTPHSCGGCASRWGGTNTAHCASCHTTFGGVSGFDAHRKDGRCLDPAAIGMHLDPGRPYPAWSQTYGTDREAAAADTTWGAPAISSTEAHR